jgi:phthalate 4,5-dioxygenase
MRPPVPDTPLAADWVRVCDLDALEPGGQPLRVTLEAERLVAFRLPDGTPGLVQERCAHRCASLVLARSEDRGLRCIYHGWLYAPDGEILDLPTEPDPARSRALMRQLRLKAWQVEPCEGALWAKRSGG